MKWLRSGRGARGTVAKVKADGFAAVGGGPGPVPVGAGAPVLQRLAGDGSRVMELTTSSAPVVVGITHHGRGHFVVDALDGRMRSGSQLVYTDGPFACRALVNADDRPVRALRIDADGPWVVEVTGLDDAVVLEEHAERGASDVLRYAGGPAVARLRYAGAPRSDGGCFLVDTFEPDGSGFLDELANHAGPWSGEVPLPGPCLIHAQSDGPWSIGVRPLAGQVY
ncbi:MULTISPECIES: hypothetical protein [unclassified Streptomyces]|uniref:hypothetical protein n=1 Tax=unclassified Streptomyces TaxID=2593676 RepID=UPI00214CC96C|nr:MULTISPECIES: hypothetical protein [unclassified Streptomyces]